MTFWSPNWRSLNPSKGHLNHPKKIKKFTGKNLDITTQYNTQRIHVWYINLHLADLYGKLIYHTLSILRIFCSWGTFYLPWSQWSLWTLLGLMWPTALVGRFFFCGKNKMSWKELSPIYPGYTNAIKYGTFEVWGQGCSVGIGNPSSEFSVSS